MVNASPTLGHQGELHTRYQVSANVKFGAIGSTVRLGQVPACDIAAAYRMKKAHFNAASTATISIGVEYSDGTSNSTSELVAATDMTSGTGLGTLAFSLVAGVKTRIAAPATITATLVATGTAATTGEADVIVEYWPLAHITGSGLSEDVY
jgi:hypothetical protein